MLLSAPSSRMFCSLSLRLTRQADRHPTKHMPTSEPSPATSAAESALNDTT